MDDPDAPMANWVHWIVYNIPVSDTLLPSHIRMDSSLANGIKQGLTSFRITGYGGPCPPEGIHRYFFKIYALDTKLKVPASLTKSQLLNSMKGHILAEADLMGRYSRTKK
jgi:Raf kinase inhibitor-like YbhB/YbcL family protein